jgi:ankyrin repeat protein
VEPANKDCWTPLKIAVTKGHVDIFWVLQKHGPSAQCTK